MIQGRNYQEAALDAALVAWGLERIDLKSKHATLIDELGKNPFTAPDGVATRTTLANMATGTGKTILAGLLIDYFAKKGMRGGFMADTNELCQQPLEKIRATTGIFAGLEKAESKAPRSASVVVASEQTLSKSSRLEAFIARWGTPQYWITDECFPAGTIVDGIPIEKRKVGDLVRSYNERTGRIEKRKILNVWKSKPRTLVSVLIDGEKIICTPGHRFLTKRGWIEAALLTDTDAVLTIEDHEARNNSLLFLQQSNSQSIPEAKMEVQKRESGMLAGVSEQKIVRQKKGIQSYEGSSRCQSKSFHETPGNEMETTSSERKRNRTNSATVAFGLCIRVGYGGGDTHQETKRRRIPTVLQGRYRKLRSENRRGSRWKFPLITVTEVARQKKGELLTWNRVDRVKVCQQTSDGKFGGLCPDGFVYNLHIEGTETYTINNRFVVHNCHRGSHAAKKIHDAFGPDCKILGITATPFRSGLRDLSDFFETVCFEFNTLDAIDAGWLVPLKVQTLPISIDLSAVKVKRKADGQSDYDENEVDEVITPYYEEIAKSLKTHAEGRKIVSFLPLKTSSKKWVEVCRDNGINARHVDGNSDDREELIVQFDRGELDLISNSQLLTAGWDCLICDCLVNMKPTRSVNQFQQMVGRTFRPLRGIVDSPGLTPEERKQRILGSEKPNSLILDLLWQVEELGLVGPGSIVASSPEMAAEIEKKLREKKTPEELREIMEQVRRDREEALRAELEAKAARKAMLMDAREIALQLRDNSILEYEPVAKWETDKPSEKQAQLLESMGIDVESVQSKGLASKLMDSIFTRQSKGMAPLEAFRALRCKGVQNPEKMSLDDAIRTLGTDFPMTFGKKYRGIPMSRVPSGFWTWMRKLPSSQLASIKLQHPAAVRYMERVTTR